MAKDTTPDRIQLHVVIDGSPARKELAELTQSAVKLKQEQKALRTEEKLLIDQRKAAKSSGDAQEAARLSEELKRVRASYGEVTDAIKVNGTAQDELRAGMGTLDLSLTELRKKQQALKAAWNSGIGSKEALLETAKELQLVEERMAALGTAQGRALAVWEEERKTIDRNKWSLEQLGLEKKRLQRIYDISEGGSGDKSKAAAELEVVTEEIRRQTTEAGRAQAAWETLRGSMTLDQMTNEQLVLEKKYLEDLVNTAKRTGAGFEKLESDLLAVDRALKQSTDQTARADRDWERMRQSMSLTDMSMEELAREIAHLKRVKESLHPETQAAQFDMYSTSLKQAESRAKTLQTGMGPLGRMFSGLKTQVLSAGAVIGGLFAGGAMVSGFRNAVTSAAEYSDAISDVRKTTGLAEPVVKELANELSRIDTRTSRAELLALARDAGKLGITAKEDVLSFVKAGNQINVALGEDLGEGAIKQIGKLVDLFKLKDQFGLEQSMLKVGSAINELGISSTASEGYMVEFMKRMGGIAPIAGITIDQTLALGATLDSLGQTSEVSSTALSKLFVKLGSDADKYAGIAGVSVDKFKDTLQNNALEALILLLEGTKKTEGGVVALSETLGDLGVDSARAAGVFGVLSENTERLKEQMVIANSAFSEGTSITDEYKLKNENLAAELAKLGKEFNRLVANNAVTKWLSGLVGTTRSVIDWIKRNADMITFLAKVLATATATWAAYRVGAVAWATASRLLTSATKALAIAKGVLTGNTMAARRAMVMFNTAVKQNPLGLLLSALTLIAGAYMTFRQEVENATSAAAEQTGELRKLYLQTLLTNQGTEERKRLIGEMKALFPEYLAHLDAEKTTNEDLAKAMTQVNDQLVNKIILGKKDDELTKLRENALNAGVKAKELELKAMDVVRAKAKSYGVDIEKIAGDGATTLQKLEALQGVINQKMGEYSQARPGQFSTNLSAEANQVQYYATQLKNLEKYYADEQQLIEQAEGDKQALLDSLNKTTKGKPAPTGLPDPAQAEAEAAKIIRTVKYLNEQIKALQEQQEVATDRAGYLKLDKEIKRLEAERDRITGGNGTGTKKLAKTQEDLTNLLEEYRKFQGELNDDRLTADERELAQLDAKHAEELKKVKEQQAKLIEAGKLSPIDATTDVGVLQDNQAAERQEMIERQGDARMKALAEQNKKIQAALGEAHNVDMQMEVARLEEEIRMGQAQNKNVLGLQQSLKDAQLRLYAQNATDLIAQEQLKWDELLDQARKALEEFDAAIESAGGEPTDQVLNDRQALTTAILELEMAEKIAIENINKDHRQREKAARRRANLEERQEYARRLQNFAQVADAVGNMVSSIIQYQDASIAAAEARADADGVRTESEIAEIDRLKAARRKAALITIAVQGAVAVANGIASAMVLPWPANLVAAASAVATVIGLIAQAKAMMNAADSNSSSQAQNTQQPQLNSIPLGADGMVGGGDRMITSREGGGVLGGQLHHNGGNNVVDSKTGRVVANVEKDELFLVMSRRATEANADLIPQLLKASRDGTRFTPFDRPVAMPDPSRISQGLRIAHMADGGYGEEFTYKLSKKRVGMVTDPSSTSPNDDLLRLMTQMVSIMGRTADAAERFPTNLKATMSVVDADRKKIEYDQVLAKSRGRKAS